MRELNLDIATKANKEEQCTGHFWESRYKSQALLDQQALVAAMAYVVLNALKDEQMTPFIGNPTNTIIKAIPLRLHDCLRVFIWLIHSE